MLGSVVVVLGVVVLGGPSREGGQAYAKSVPEPRTSAQRVWQLGNPDVLSAIDAIQTTAPLASQGAAHMIGNKVSPRIGETTTTAAPRDGLASKAASGVRGSARQHRRSG